VIRISDEVHKTFKIEKPMNTADSYNGITDCRDFVDVLLKRNNGKH